MIINSEYYITFFWSYANFLLVIILSSLHKVHKAYEGLRTSNVEPVTMAVVFKTLLKDDLGTAYSECIEFNKRMGERKKGLSDTIDEFYADHPTNSEYFRFAFESDDVKFIESELSMITDALNCLTMKRELLLDAKKETGNMQEVFALAVSNV